jgi:hypothetical protein
MFKKSLSILLRLTQSISNKVSAFSIMSSICIAKSMPDLSKLSPLAPPELKDIALQQMLDF